MLNLSVFLISLRDFLEAFLLIILLYSFSKKEGIKQENLIILGGASGLIISFTVALFVYNILPFVHFNLPISVIDATGHIFIILAGILLIYITQKIHPLVSKFKNKHLSPVFLEKNVLETPFFLITFLLVLQEGFEIIIFTATFSFFHSVISNTLSLAFGFAVAFLSAVLIYNTFLRNHIAKFFKAAEILLILYGVYLIAHGLIELFL